MACSWAYLCSYLCCCCLTNRHNVLRSLYTLYRTASRMQFKHAVRYSIDFCLLFSYVFGLRNDETLNSEIYHTRSSHKFVTKHHSQTSVLRGIRKHCSNRLSSSFKLQTPIFRDMYGMEAEHGRCVGPDKLKPLDLRFFTAVKIGYDTV